MQKRSEAEAEHLLNLLQSVPAPKTDPTPAQREPKSTKWKQTSTTLKNHRRVNLTKGK